MDESSQQPRAPKGAFPVWAGMILVAEITAAILVPMAVVGGFGYWLDTRLGTGKIAFFISMVCAFLLSNYLVWRKSQEILNKYKR